MVGWLLRLADRARHRARVKRAAAEQALGRRGEDLAHRFLEGQGLVVVARNYRPPSGVGELDLVAWDGDALAIIEVKCRDSREHGGAGRNIDADKQRAMVSAARYYARLAGVPWERVRFDVVGVVLGNQPELRHQRDALRVPAKL